MVLCDRFIYCIVKFIVYSWLYDAVHAGNDNSNAQRKARRMFAFADANDDGIFLISL